MEVGEAHLKYLEHKCAELKTDSIDCSKHAHSQRSLHINMHVN